jgi:hypothetical protein
LPPTGESRTISAIASRQPGQPAIGDDNFDAAVMALVISFLSDPAKADAMTSPPKDLNTVTAPVLARWLGVSGKAVYELAKAGHVVRANSHLYRLEESVTRYCEHLRQTAAPNGHTIRPHRTRWREWNFFRVVCDRSYSPKQPTMVGVAPDPGKGRFDRGHRARDGNTARHSQPRPVLLFLIDVGSSATRATMAVQKHAVLPLDHSSQQIQISRGVATQKFAKRVTLPIVMGVCCL